MWHLFYGRLSQIEMDDYFDKTIPSIATAVQLNDAIYTESILF